MFNSHTQKVAERNKRNYAFDLAKLWLGRKRKMSKQAKTLTAIELRRVLDYVATRKHAARNRAVLLLMYYAGLRVGEAASLRLCDVVDNERLVRNEFQLRADQTKGGHARTVFVSEKLRKELTAYIAVTKFKKTTDKLFYSQKAASDGFTANTLTQHFHYLYRRAGVIGASSHSTRRTFITNLAAQGISVRVLASLAGHRSIATTQAYIDVNDDQKRKAVELV
jgi:integrase/recombinase XerD